MTSNLGPQSSKVSQIQSKGIYHGLPVFDSDVKGLTAIVTGANGISGWHMVKVLSQSPERWSKIYCLSRRPPAIPGGLPKNAEFVSIDFMKSPEEIADGLKAKGVQADCVFFYAYIQVTPQPGQRMWPPEEMAKQNTTLLSNFLGALPLANVTPKRVMLQTGAKNYGIHLGPSKLPQRESDPRVELEPNFYYPQEDVLAKYCKDNSVKYSLGMPCGIVGAVPDAAMNLAFPLAIYCSVQAHLKKPLEFPGGIAEWQNPQDQSSAMLNAYLEEWSVLIDQEKTGEKYNCVDNCPFTWEGLWPLLAEWYGIEWTGPKTDGLQTFTTPHDPPPRGYGGPAKVAYSYRFTDWAKSAEVQSAWKEIAQQHGLSYKELHDQDRIFGFLDGMMLQSYPLYFSLDKAHKRGWFGFVDSRECILETFRDFAGLGLVPPVPEGARVED